MVIPISQRIERTKEQLEEIARQLHKARFAVAPIKRASRLTRPSHCAICDQPIHPGEHYRDAGIRCRAHEKCLTSPTE